MIVESYLTISTLHSVSLFKLRYMDDVKEGPVVSPDELEMLSDVLRKKLDGFGGAQGSSILPSLTTFKLNNHCVKSVEAYKNGQRELLQLALSELDALMPGGE